MRGLIISILFASLTSSAFAIGHATNISTAIVDSMNKSNNINQAQNNISITYGGQDISRVPPIMATANQSVWSNQGNLVG